jgi:hypothetical protein
MPTTIAAISEAPEAADWATETVSPQLKSNATVKSLDNDDTTTWALLRNIERHRLVQRGGKTLRSGGPHNFENRKTSGEV